MDQSTGQTCFSDESKTPRGRSSFRHARSLRAGEIRLLNIRSEHEGTVKYELTYHQLDNAPPYTALSYAWGWVAITNPIECDGEQLFVSKSVAEALVLLRTHVTVQGRCGPLWIDAICIKQDDITEKTRSVRMMTRIYECASIVVGYLGAGSPADDVGFELINKIWNILESCAGTSDAVSLKRREDVNSLNHSNLLGLGLPHGRDEAWKAAMRILNRPWFTRVWIIQEFVHARNFYFMSPGRLIRGHQLAEPARALFKSLWFSTHIGSPQGYAESTGHAASLATLKVLKEYEEPLRLVELLESTHIFESSDPRDKIFAIVSMSADVDVKIVDYALDLSMTLIKATLEVIRNDEDSLEMVFAMAASLERHVNVPSWVPVWSSTEFVTGE